jgi:hypothetical protein
VSNFGRHGTKALRTLVWDVENGPSGYLGSDFTTAKLTVITAKVLGEETVYAWLLVPEHLVDAPAFRGLPTIARGEGLKEFGELRATTDVDLGHNLIRHDLGHVNGALARYGFKLLDKRPVIDTYAQLVKPLSGISKGLGNLASLLGVPESKGSTNAATWDRANDYEPAAMLEVLEYAKQDVVVTELVYLALLEKGYLRP